MEPSAIERDLDELEIRIERLRALYEQYFMGLEKLEPQIPRKEVERRIHLLRKEQIRNTALRFKFQMLIQRYNTLQQYWARVTREIENGTYRRDVMRAAARFGAKDALTILGKRRAEKYAALAAAQGQRKAQGPPADPEEEEVELDSEDLIDDEDVLSLRDVDAIDAPATFLPLVTPAPPLPLVTSTPPLPAPARQTSVVPPRVATPASEPAAAIERASGEPRAARAVRCGGAQPGARSEERHPACGGRDRRGSAEDRGEAPRGRAGSGDAHLAGRERGRGGAPRLDAELRRARSRSRGVAQGGAGRRGAAAARSVQAGRAQFLSLH
jgi:hypothetical protein